jgi:hypothetical protein
MKIEEEISGTLSREETKIKLEEMLKRNAKESFHRFG